ncbi:hypothetical protein B0H13DRAFT_1915878 [Mycena leptocephala]|nr:hypothetical protein B0H13DRAFT_1915878 [Mycena leptocephala]
MVTFWMGSNRVQGKDKDLVFWIYSPDASEKGTWTQAAERKLTEILGPYDNTMSTILGVIDPALVNLPGGSTNGPEPPRTNGATTSRNGSRLPQASSAARPRTYSKAEIEAWAASNYAPWRDANEMRSEYDERLTNISRKNTLLEACNKLDLKVPKSTNLDRLHAELSKHWFTSLANRAPSTSTRRPSEQAAKRSARPATDAHDVLASVLAPAGQSFHFPAPAGTVYIQK